MFNIIVKDNFRLIVAKHDNLNIIGKNDDIQFSSTINWRLINWLNNGLKFTPKERRVFKRCSFEWLSDVENMFCISLLKHVSSNEQLIVTENNSRGGAKGHIFRSVEIIFMAIWPHEVKKLSRVKTTLKVENVA